MENIYRMIPVIKRKVIYKPNAVLIKIYLIKF